MKYRGDTHPHISKERPRCRAVILRLGLRPKMENGKWDGFTASDNEHETVFMSDGVRKQLRRMLLLEDYQNYLSKR